MQLIIKGEKPVYSYVCITLNKLPSHKKALQLDDVFWPQSPSSATPQSFRRFQFERLMLSTKKHGLLRPLLDRKNK